MATALITGGAGYIGSLLTGILLRSGYRVVVLDDLLFGGDSLLSYLPDPHFSFVKCDVSADETDQHFRGVDVVFHLAALVGFPICQQVGKATAFRYNFEATKAAFHAAEKAGVRRFIFASTYSNYGIAPDGKPVTEESPLFPQSLYAETKIASERFLLEEGKTSSCIPVIPRFTTLYGVSPRTRFDLIINQFVLEALTQRKLVIYQGNYSRSFVDIRDVIDALLALADVPDDTVRNQIFNIGNPEGNYTKQQIVELIQRHVPKVEIEYRDISFGQDMRDVQVSFDKAERVLTYRATRTVEEGIIEVAHAIQSGLIKEPTSGRYRNHQFSVH